jgi:hypothetical protein
VPSRSILTTAAIVAASLSLTAGPALAKGGGNGGGGTGGGGQPAPSPAPEPAASLCPEFADGGTYQADGSLLFANDFPGQMCLVARYTTANVLSLSEIRLAPGWTAATKSAGGSSSNKIDVTWRNAATGEQHEIVEQPGKTVVK